MSFRPMRRHFNRKCRQVSEGGSQSKLSVCHCLADKISADMCFWGTTSATKGVRQGGALLLLCFNVMRYTFREQVASVVR